MKSSVFLMLFVLTLSLAVKAWKEVGNAAGLSEQNVIYALQKSEEVVLQVGGFGGTAADENFLKEFAVELKSAKLQFSYDENPAQVFDIQGPVWVIYSQKLLQYDLDQNEVLSLKESYGLLLDILSAKKGYAKDKNTFADFQEFKKKFLKAVDAVSKTLVMRTFQEEIQWTELAGSYYVFFADTEPLELTAEVLAPRLCSGPMTAFKLADPVFTSAQRRATSVRMMVTARAYFECGGRPAAKTLMLDIVADLKGGKLTLR